MIQRIKEIELYEETAKIVRCAIKQLCNGGVRSRSKATHIAALDEVVHKIEIELARLAKKP
jgi:hypothetical protein